jgi:pimeloyl-ACP methyl ester carboxylesterase
VRDVAAAVGRVRAAARGPTLVCGWSFGANVALREALDDERVAALALIGYPLDHALELPASPPAAQLRRLRRPVLLLSGDRDPYAPPEAVRALARDLALGEVALVPGTDHHLWRREGEAAAIVGAFAERVVGEGGPD